MVGDSLDESDETFFVNLTVPVNATISDNQAVGTITDDDATPTVSIADASKLEGNGVATSGLPFTVSLSAASGLPVTVQYATSDGTADDGGPGLCIRQRHADDRGGREQRRGDGDDPGRRRTGAESDLHGRALQPDQRDPGQPDNRDGHDHQRRQCPDLLDREPLGGRGHRHDNQFRLHRLAGQPAGDATVQYATSNGTANGDTSCVSPADYLSTSGTLTFNATTSRTLTVQVCADTRLESSETFTVGLSNPQPSNQGALIAAGQGNGVGTITNDDTLTFAIDSVSTPEGNSGTTPLVFTATRGGDTSVSASVSYATSDGNGPTGATVASSDYQAASGTLTFAASETTKPITVLVNGDTALENAETFSVTLSSPQPSGATLVQGRHRYGHHPG